MADISQITLPTGTTYDLKDKTARELIENLNSGSSDINPNPKTKIWTGVCETESNIGEKVAILDNGNGFSLTTGVIIAITFTQYNTAIAPTLQVNYTDDTETLVTGTPKEIAYHGAVISSDSNYIVQDRIVSGVGGRFYNTWGSYETVFFTYDGTYWVRDTVPEVAGMLACEAYYDSNVTAKKYSRVYGRSKDLASSKYKTLNLSSDARAGLSDFYGRNEGQRLVVRLDEGHDSDVELYISVSSDQYGAIPVYYEDEIWTKEIPANYVCDLIYEGSPTPSHWQFLNPPVTTGEDYTEMTNDALTTGTDTTLMVVSPKVLHDYIDNAITTALEGIENGSY